MTHITNLQVFENSIFDNFCIFCKEMQIVLECDYEYNKVLHSRFGPFNRLFSPKYCRLVSKLLFNLAIVKRILYRKVSKFLVRYSYDFNIHEPSFLRL